MSISPLWQARFWSMLAVSLPVLIEDVRTRRIPNWCCAALLVCGLVIGVADAGIAGLASSLLGALAGFFVFLVFYISGGMGGGDIKLMAACGSIVGVRALPVSAVLTAILGAAIAVLAACFGMARRRRMESIPYAPAIVLGSLLALFSRTG